MRNAHHDASALACSRSLRDFLLWMRMMESVFCAAPHDFVKFSFYFWCGSIILSGNNVSTTETQPFLFEKEMEIVISCSYLALSGERLRNPVVKGKKDRRKTNEVREVIRQLKEHHGHRCHSEIHLTNLKQTNKSKFIKTKIQHFRIRSCQFK